MRIQLRSILVVLLLILVQINTLAQIKEEMRAVKLTNVDSQILFSDQAIEEAIDYLASIGINAVLPVTFNAAKTQYPSLVMNEYLDLLIDPRMEGRDPFKRVLIEAHRHGMEVYPWFEYGFAAWYSGGGEANGGPFGARYPHWLSVDVEGNITKKNGFDWLNGLHPEVQTFMNRLVLEMVDTYDIDGIEFSDRIPALPVEGGYDSTTVQLYRSETGKNPPDDYRESGWKRWRANKLSDFYEFLKDSVKKRDAELVVATSPSLYPWGYEEYLQDNVMWVNHNIVDHYIPQLYRQNLPDYQYELNRTIEQTLAHKRAMIFAGILMNVGSYTVSADLLRNMLNYNRSRGLLGEAYFFYEGFKRNGNELGNMLKTEFYSEPAVVPLRNGKIRRPKAIIAKGKSVIDGNWKYSGLKTDYQKDSMYVQLEANSAFNLTYSFEVPVPAWYDMYYYNQPDLQVLPPSQIQLTGKGVLGDTVLSVPFRSSQYGWTFVGTLPVEQTTAEISLKSSDVVDGTMFAPSVMLLINRKRSPKAEILNTSLVESKPEQNKPHQTSILSTYPNPFNPSVTIRINPKQTGPYRFDIVSVTGQLIFSSEKQLLLQQQQTEFPITLKGKASGLYLVRLWFENQLLETQKITLIK